MTEYLDATQLKLPREELLTVLADPENGYDTAPGGSLNYAAFLARAGIIKAATAAWTDLFLPELHDRKGS